MKKKFLSILTAIAVAVSLSACRAEDTGQAPPLSETTQVEAITQTSETTVAENLEETQPEENTQTDIAITENTDKNIETVVIAGKEYLTSETEITLFLFDNSDFSNLQYMENLKTLTLTSATDGLTSISNLEPLKKLSELENLTIEVYISEPKELEVLTQLPKLKTFNLFGTYDWSYNLPSIESMYIMGTFELSKIEHLTSLKKLSLEYNFSEDLSSIEKLSLLEEISITECGFTDYESILKLNNLKKIFISSVPMEKSQLYSLEKKFGSSEIMVINVN